jgi:hypothetical protein
LAGLLASAIVYLCFLTWLRWKAVSFVKEQGAMGLIGVTGAQVYVLHSPSFWALAISDLCFSYFVTRRSSGRFATASGFRLFNAKLHRHSSSFSGQTIVV